MWTFLYLRWVLPAVCSDSGWDYSSMGRSPGPPPAQVKKKKAVNLCIQLQKHRWPVPSLWRRKKGATTYHSILITKNLHTNLTPSANCSCLCYAQTPAKKRCDTASIFIMSRNLFVLNKQAAWRAALGNAPCNTDIVKNYSRFKTAAWQTVQSTTFNTN